MAPCAQACPSVAIRTSHPAGTGEGSAAIGRRDGLRNGLVAPASDDHPVQERSTSLQTPPMSESVRDTRGCDTGINGMNRTTGVEFIAAGVLALLLVSVFALLPDPAYYDALCEEYNLSWPWL